MIDEKKLIEDVLNTSKDISSEWETAGILNLIHKQPKVGGWIPCSERLPKIADVYNVTRKISEDKYNFYISDSAYFDGQNTWHSYNRVNHGREYLKDVVAWMPLPEPYREKVQE